MKQEKFIAAFLCVLLAIGALAGCKESGRQIDKNSVVIAISSEPESLDPTVGWGHGTAPLIQSTLIEYRQDMTFVNDLATEYAVSPDGLKWTFKIRNDAKFTDGEPVKASDVAFTFMTAKDAKSSLDLTYLDKAEAVSENTVVFTLSRPTSTFLNLAATTGIVPQHAYGADYGTNPIGSGPYKFVQWNKGEQLQLTANEDYYGEQAKIKNVTLVFMSEDAAFAAAKAGQVDIAQTSTSLAATNKIDEYFINAITTLDNRGFTLPVVPDEGKLSADGYPVGNDVTANLEIRQAIAYAIDRDKLAKDAVYGYGDPAYSENDGMPWNNPEVKINTDVEYAKQLLKDNGWIDSDGDGIVEKDGLKAEFMCVYPTNDSVRQAIALAAADQVKQIGINIVVEGTSWDEISKKMFSNAVLMGWGSSTPQTTYYLYHSSNKLKSDFYNPEGFDNQTVDMYLDKALTSLTSEEANQNWKLAQWDGAVGTAMKGECPWVWLVNVKHVYFTKDSLNIGEQQLHAHGASMPLIQNLKEWYWE